jgi:predicted nuclease of predicted toxin-antitoxin system
MKIWIDAQLLPEIASWIRTEFTIEALAVRDLGLRDASDQEIFQAAKAADCVVMTKDRDFLNLLDQFGPPPTIVWLTCGNTSNAALKDLLSKTLIKAMDLLSSGEQMVEIYSS